MRQNVLHVVFRLLQSKAQAKRFELCLWKKTSTWNATYVKIVAVNWAMSPKIDAFRLESHFFVIIVTSNVLR